MSDPQQPGQPYDPNQPNPYGQQGQSGQPGQPEPQYGQPGQQGNPYAQPAPGQQPEQGAPYGQAPGQGQQGQEPHGQQSQPYQPGQSGPETTSFGAASQSPYAQQGQPQQGQPQGWPGQDQYGQNPYGAGSGGNGGGSKKGLWITLIAVAAVIVLAFGAFFGIRAFTHKDEPINADPTPSVQPSDSTPDESPTESPEQNSPEQSSPGIDESSDPAGPSDDASPSPSASSDDPFGDGAGDTATPSLGPDLSYSERERIAQLGAEQIKKQWSLPHRVDEVTELRDVKGEGATVHYFYDVDKSVSASQVSRSSIRSTVTKQVCSNSQSRALLQSDIDMRYSYTIAGKTDAVNFTVHGSDC